MFTPKSLNIGPLCVCVGGVLLSFINAVITWF